MSLRPQPHHFTSLHHYLAAIPPPKKAMVLCVPIELNRVTKNFLLIRRFKDTAIYPSLINFPGGRVESNETAAEAAEREFTEETGLCLRSPKLMGCIAPAEDDPDEFLVLIYTGQYYYSIAAAQKIRADEHHRPHQTMYGTAAQMMHLECIPNIPIIAALCSHRVGQFVIQDNSVLTSPSYHGTITLYNKVPTNEPDRPHELPWGTVPPAH